MRPIMNERTPTSLSAALPLRRNLRHTGTRLAMPELQP